MRKKAKRFSRNSYWEQIYRETMSGETSEASEIDWEKILEIQTERIREALGAPLTDESISDPVLEDALNLELPFPE